MEQIIRQRKLSEIGEVLINQKKETGYAQSSIRICENELERLRVFMEHEGDELYCIDVGARYLATDYCNKTALRHSKCKSFISLLNDCMLYGRYTLYHLDKKTASMPGRFTGIEEKYISWCREKGNGSVTLRHKHHAFACFFSFVESIGCDEAANLSPEFIARAVLNEKCTDYYRYFREMLRFMAEKGIVRHDYSALIPKARGSFHLPSTYEKGERRLLENAPDRCTASGKRNYAIILLANRLGIRNGDIAGLTFDEVLFEQDRIIFRQEKTKDIQELYLVQDVKEALLDYIKNSRPDSGSGHIFLSCRAPYNPIDPATVYSIIEKGFKDAGIDTEGKKHGGIHYVHRLLRTWLIQASLMNRQEKSWGIEALM